MKLHKQFSWVVATANDALIAVDALNDRDSYTNIASLFVEHDEQVEPITTADVTMVIVQRLHAQYIRVTAMVTFELDDDTDLDAVEYGPYNFVGEDDGLPEVKTYEFAGDPPALIPSRGEPDLWGNDAPVVLTAEEARDIIWALGDASSLMESMEDPPYDEDDEDADETMDKRRERVDNAQALIESKCSDLPPLLNPFGGADVPS